jgi:hypothetical protein
MECELVHDHDSLCCRVSTTFDAGFGPAFFAIRIVCSGVWKSAVTIAESRKLPDFATFWILA